MYLIYCKISENEIKKLSKQLSIPLVIVTEILNEAKDEKEVEAQKSEKLAEMDSPEVSLMTGNRRKIR